MKKLILTSAGLANPKITEAFLKLADKSASEIKLIFIPTASRTKEELHYVNISKKELVELGIKRKNIKTFNLDRKISYGDVADFDVIYVCGGNTFYLLKKVRENGFDGVIRKFVENGGIYFGVSAGSNLAGPNIEIASLGDENDVGLKDFTGLNLIDAAICPHSDKKNKNKIDAFKKKARYKIVPLTDSQALLVLDNHVKIIGD